VRIKRLLAVTGLVGVSVVALGGVLGSHAGSASAQTNPTNTPVPATSTVVAATATAGPPSPPGTPAFVGTPPAVPLTVTPAPTGVALSAHLMAVAGVHVSRHGNTVTFHWTATLPSQVKHFNVFAGSTKLNTRAIAVHKSASYSYSVKWSGSGAFALGVVYKDGFQLKVAGS